MTQSIPIKASGNIFEATGSADFARRSRDSKFEMFLDNSINRDTKISVKAKAITNGEKHNSPVKKDFTNFRDKVMATVQDNKDIVSDKSNIDPQAVQDISVDDENSTDVDPLNMLGQILAMLGQIKDVIKEELEITSEELDNMMERLEINLSDLIEPQAIAGLVLEDSGSNDPFAMLVDEQLGDTFQSLLMKVDEIKNQADLSVTDDDIKLILQESIDSDISQALVATDQMDTEQPIISLEQPDEDDAELKDNNLKYQILSEDKQSSDKGTVISTKTEGNLKDTDDGKAKSERTDGFEVFLDKLSANYDKPIVEFSDNTVRLYEIREIAQQIINQIRVTMTSEQTTMELQLNPEHLGKVNLTISSKEGVMTAHFSVQNDLAKEAIEGQLITLKDTLAQQGIKVENIDVTVTSYTFDQNNSSNDAEQMMQKKQKTGSKITFEEAVAMSEEPLEDADNMNLTGAMGYTINYKA